MTMASAKNWHSIAVLTSTSQYAGFIESLKNQNGRISLEQRFKLATEAMQSIGEYRTAIGNYFSALDFEKDVRPFLEYYIAGLKRTGEDSLFRLFFRHQRGHVSWRPG